MELNHITVFILVSAEIIANGLFFHVQFLRNAGNAAMRKCVLNSAQFIECDVHMQIV
jgi:predicted TIM-barrel enzyme